MFKNQIYKLIIIFSVAVLVLPVAASAAIVPCGELGNPCNLCDLYDLTQNIVNFLMWGVAPSLAVFIIAWGGFNILIAGGEPAKKQAGYKAIKTAIIGLLIVFGAWIIINEFLLFFSGQATGTAKIFYNPWTEVRCEQ